MIVVCVNLIAIGLRGESTVSARSEASVCLSRIPGFYMGLRLSSRGLEARYKHGPATPVTWEYLGRPIKPALVSVSSGPITEESSRNRSRSTTI